MGIVIAVACLVFIGALIWAGYVSSKRTEIRAKDHLCEAEAASLRAAEQKAGRVVKDAMTAVSMYVNFSQPAIGQGSDALRRLPVQGYAALGAGDVFGRLISVVSKEGDDLLYATERLNARTADFNTTVTAPVARLIAASMGKQSKPYVDTVHQPDLAALIHGAGAGLEKLKPPDVDGA